MSKDAWERKVDHRLRALWVSVAEAERANRRVHVFYQFRGPVARLQQLGAHVGSVVGDIAPGTLLLIDLPRIASASEVVFIEMGQPLAPDGS